MLIVKKNFKLNTEKGIIDFSLGERIDDEDLEKHWFVLAHCEPEKEPEAKPKKQKTEE